MATSGPRSTPAGLATLRLQVKHTSMQQEAGKTRPVEVETEVVAFGQVAQGLSKIQPGTDLTLTGFIDRKGARDPRLELHVTEFGIPAPR
jgi:primosomal replication protein PriB